MALGVLEVRRREGLGFAVPGAPGDRKVPDLKWLYRDYLLSPETSASLWKGLAPSLSRREHKVAWVKTPTVVGVPGIGVRENKRFPPILSSTPIPCPLTDKDTHPKPQPLP